MVSSPRVLRVSIGVASGEKQWQIASGAVRVTAWHLREQQSVLLCVRAMHSKLSPVSERGAFSHFEQKCTAPRPMSAAGSTTSASFSRTNFRSSCSSGKTPNSPVMAAWPGGDACHHIQYPSDSHEACCVCADCPGRHGRDSSRPQCETSVDSWKQGDGGLRLPCFWRENLRPAVTRSSGA